ncbi:hypothetical protein KC336_g46 [Hortaea werneckii]|nr:hypothetical protein KC336_g46 [Hortaea werneckii]
MVATLSSPRTPDARQVEPDRWGPCPHGHKRNHVCQMNRGTTDIMIPRPNVTQSASRLHPSVPPGGKRRKKSSEYVIRSLPQSAGSGVTKARDNPHLPPESATFPVLFFQNLCGECRARKPTAVCAHTFITSPCRMASTSYISSPSVSAA